MHNNMLHNNMLHDNMCSNNHLSMQSSMKNQQAAQLLTQFHAQFLSLSVFLPCQNLPKGTADLVPILVHTNKGSVIIGSVVAGIDFLAANAN